MATLRHRGSVLKLPHFKFERSGRWQPRFEPSPDLRAAGWTGYALKDEHGRWLDRDATVERAFQILQEIEAWRAGQQPDVPSVKAHVRARTIAHLMQVYRQADEFLRDIKPDTRRDYARALDAVLALIPPDIAVDAIDGPAIKALYAKLRRTHGHATANHHMRVLQRAWGIGMDYGVAIHDPFKRFRLKGTPPRVRFVEETELQALISSARTLGHHTMAALLATAVVTGQRQGDLLKLPRNIVTRLDREATTPRQHGEDLIQGKRGAIINLPPSLLNILRGTLTDQAAHARNVIKATRRNYLPTELFIRESTGLAYPDRHAVNKDFLKTRAHAAETCPSLLGLNADKTPITDPATGEDLSAQHRATFADLRDTAVTRMVLADCNIGEVCKITGHSERSALTVWKHYLALRPEMADSAGRKVARWCEQNGISY